MQVQPDQTGNSMVVSRVAEVCNERRGNVLSCRAGAGPLWEHSEMDPGGS